MAKYTISAKGSLGAIELTEVAGRQAELLEAFGECQEGRCWCPTGEYLKVAAMDVQPDHGAEGGDDRAPQERRRLLTDVDDFRHGSCLARYVMSPLAGSASRARLRLRTQSISDISRRADTSVRTRRPSALASSLARWMASSGRSSWGL